MPSQSSIELASARRCRGVLRLAENYAEALAIGSADYEVAAEADYYFTADDGSVYTIQGRRLFGLGRYCTTPQRVFVAGPREGETEDMTWEQIDAHVEAAEAKYGKYVPGGLLSEPCFIPGTERKTMPLSDDRGNTIGYIDEDGVHKWYTDDELENLPYRA